MRKELNTSLDKFPFEYPIKLAFKIYASRLIMFGKIVIINIILLGFVILLIKQNSGGGDAALKLLIALIIIDYATGFLGAVKNKTLNSEVMYWRGIRKGVILAVVIVAVLLDKMVGHPELTFRRLTISFYVISEGISVTENLGILGVWLPPSIVKALEQLQQRREGKRRV